MPVAASLRTSEHPMTALESCLIHIAWPQFSSKSDSRQHRPVLYVELDQRMQKPCLAYKFHDQLSVCGPKKHSDIKEPGDVHY